MYAFEPLTRLLSILDMILMAFLYSADNLQAAVVTSWSGVQLLFMILVQPYVKRVILVRSH